MLLFFCGSGETCQKWYQTVQPFSGNCDEVVRDMKTNLYMIIHSIWRSRWLGRHLFDV